MAENVLERKNKTKDKTSKKNNKMYHIVLFNNPTTSFETVCMILQTCFEKSMNDAFQIAMNAHCNNSAVVGTYTSADADDKLEYYAAVKARFRDASNLIMEKQEA